MGNQTNIHSVPISQSNWSSPLELLKEVPRSCRPSEEFYRQLNTTLTLSLWGIIPVAIIFVCFLGSLYHWYSLHRDGAHTYGYVTSFYEIVGKARGSRSRYAIEYSYIVPENKADQNVSRTYHGMGSLYRTYASFPEVWNGMEISITYDPLNPQDSMLTADSRLNDFFVIGKIALVSFVFSVFIVASFVLLIYFLYRKQKRLLKWGLVSAAKVEDMAPGRPRVGGWSVTFSFQDHSGATVKGKSIVSEDDWYEIDEHRFNQWTVLFDAGNSSSFTPYPLRFVTCIPSS